MYKKFTDLVDIVGSRPKVFKNTKKYVSTGAIKIDFISEAEIEIVDYLSRPSRANLEANEGDILFAKMAYTDKRLLVNDTNSNYIYSTGFFAVRPKAGIITSKCLYFLLKSETFRNQKDLNSTGATQKAITIEGLKKIYLRFPEFSKQDQIGQILENLEKIIKYRQLQLTQYDALIKSRFVEMFGDPYQNPMNWPTSKLEDLIVKSNNGMSRRGCDEQGSIVLRLVELQDGYIDYEKPNRIKLNEAEKARYLLEENDFLFARVNGNPENVGRCAVFNRINEDVYHNDHTIRVHFNESKLEGVFASTLLNSDYGKNQMKGQIKTSAGQYTISQSGIGAIVTILPTIELQHIFANFVKHVDKLKFSIQQSLDETQKLFDSLMQEYFG